jgi:hypothetical protein
MASKPTFPPDWLLDATDVASVAAFLARRRNRLALAWVVALAFAVVVLRLAWVSYARPDRPDGNVGHVFIDFSGQWLMGRALARDRGPELYRRSAQDELLHEAYPEKDADDVLSWLIVFDEGRPDKVGGPLYPPIHALLFYPLGLLPPQVAYRTAQVVNWLLTFLIGFLVERLTRGRVWTPVAVVFLILFPGYNGAISLGQNSLLSLAILLSGWLALGRGRPWLAGVVWGLLAFKPVWAAAFFLVPLLTGRWRTCLAMLLTGAALAALTLPFVGVQAWRDWLAVGNAATVHYATDEPWVFLSRDLQGLPRRWLVHFQDMIAVEDGRPELATRLGLGLWGAVAAGTAGVTLAARLLRRPVGLEGPSAAFLLLGAFLSCFHFMYYDVLLAGLPIVLLFTDPARYLTPAPFGRAGPRGGWVWNAFAPTLLVLLIVLTQAADGVDYWFLGRKSQYPPFDTFCLLALWLWCGWKWLRAPEATLVPTR